MQGFNHFRRYLFLAILVLPGGSYYGTAQPAADSDFVKQYRSYQGEHFQEKIFAHTSKSFYICGELIWFKLYNVDASFNRPAATSKVAYVEILSNDHTPVLQAKVELNQGSGSGSFMLPFSLSSGVYTFRAYTSWMKNYSPDLFFETPLTIVNTLKKLPVPEKERADFGIQFFPEGGNLVNGLPGKVAFHAVGSNGSGVSCRGIIVNQRNDTITAFQSARFGMGTFMFTPVKDDVYKAIVQANTGPLITRNLPAAFNSGYVMAVSFPDDGQIKVTVRSSKSSPEKISLFVHTRQLAKKMVTQTMNNGLTEFNIPAGELGEGISRLTIFNSMREPLCERLYCRRPTEKLSIGVATDRQEYALRKKVRIEVSAADSAVLNSVADLSLSVLRIDSLQQIPEQDIRAYLWFTSELRGNIESPAYYLDGMDEQAKSDLDNLMLTHGWSRYKWEEITNGKRAGHLFLPEYEGPVVSGRLKERATGMAAGGVETYLSVPGERLIFKTCTSDQDGRFVFNVNRFYGNNEVIIQPSNKFKTSYTIDIINPFAGDFSSRKYPALHLPEALQEEVLYRSVEAQVENRYVQQEKARFYFPSMSDTTAFYGSPDKVYRLDDYTRFITMEEVMREYVTEVRVRKQQEGFTFQSLNSSTKLFFDNPPLVLIDGLPVFDINKIIAFNPLKVRSLELVTRKFFSANNVFEGIVSYKTYKGDLEGFELEPGALVLDYPGVQLPRQFYAPIYETTAEEESRTPDFRNVLYWEPAIKVSGSLKKQLEFFTSDRPGKYAVVVQGISKKGAAASKTLFFTVKK